MNGYLLTDLAAASPTPPVMAPPLWRCQIIRISFIFPPDLPSMLAGLYKSVMTTLKLDFIGRKREYAAPGRRIVK